MSKLGDWLYELFFWRRLYKREQDELWRLESNGHDISMIPGGHLIHYSICWCKEQKHV